jgi:hypothetical protein
VVDNIQNVSEDKTVAKLKIFKRRRRTSSGFVELPHRPVMSPFRVFDIVNHLQCSLFCDRLGFVYG